MSRFFSRNKTTGIIIGVIIILAIAAFYVAHAIKTNSNAKTAIIPTPVATPTPIAKPTVVPYVSVVGTMYHTIKIVTANPPAELAGIVGADNVQTVLEINRIDAASLSKGRVLVVPNTFADLSTFAPFPATIASASDIPKLMVVSLQMQAFAVYESGTLVRWGGVNTGKQSTPTPSRLYFANWKGKSVVSSEDDSWVLPWYVNLDNARGISMHQYVLPGYPASHACIRMFEQDAEWVYNWVDQWRVSDDGETVLAHGTPVLVFGQYAYGKTAPWKNLAKDPTATTISSDTIEAVVSDNKAAILAGN